MWADLLHSFYRRQVTIRVGGKLYRTWMRWYKAPDGAKQLPIPNAILADPWEAQHEAWGIPVGHWLGPRKWDRGLNTGGYKGLCFVGRPEWYRTLDLPVDVLGLDAPPLPDCCRRNPATSSGAIILSSASHVDRPPLPASSSGALILSSQSPAGPPYAGGSSGPIILASATVVNLPPQPALPSGAIILGSIPSPLPSPSPSASGGGQFPETDGCPACPDGAASIYEIATPPASEGTCGDCSAFAGVWKVRWQVGCIWEGTGPSLCGQTNTFWSLTISPTRVDLLGSFANYAAIRAGWDCLSPLTLTLLGGGSGCVWPVFVTLTPAP